MVFKSWSATPAQERAQTTCPRASQDVARQPLVYASASRVEPLTLLTNTVLQAAYEQMRQLCPMPQNDSSFDMFLGLPFTKGMTSRSTGQTLLIGSNLHHIEAGPAVYSNVGKSAAGKKNYGDTIRWFNAGDLKSGFIGLDYQANATTTAGVARSREDVSFLAKTLLEFGYDPQKRLFLLRPPYIVESSVGIGYRAQGLEKLADWTR